MVNYSSPSFKTNSDISNRNLHSSSSRTRYNGVTIPNALLKCRVSSKQPLEYKAAVLDLLNRKYTVISKNEIIGLENFCVKNKVNFLLATLLKLNNKDLDALLKLKKENQTFRVYIEKQRDFFKAYPKSIDDFAELLK